MTTATGTYRSLVPVRLDRLPWSPFHTRVVAALGISWILDGLEIQIISQIGAVLQSKDTLHLTGGEIGLIATVYLLGEVAGALFFGRITDRLGRTKLFFFTLALYLIANGAAGFSPNLWFLLFFRFLAGAGIGGEYTAINSAIDELIPPYYRGRVDIFVSGTYWVGAMFGAFANIFLLNPELVPTGYGWRIGFFLGPIIALSIIVLRRTIPESPRWLMTHGRQVDAELIVDEIETRVLREGIELEPVSTSKALDVTGRGNVSYRQIRRTMWHDYRSRSLVGISLMASQSFLYNAIFFTDGTLLTKYYGVAIQDTGYYLLPFALGNFLGPLILGKFFDTIGRRKMLTFTYCLSGVLVMLSAPLFFTDLLSATSQTAIWCAIFFFASAGASAAYLTVSEIFPLEMRAQAISFFFAIPLLVFGVPAPWVFATLVESNASHLPLTVGYLVAGLFMIAGGFIAWRYGVDAERKSLERIAHPLAAIGRPIEPSVGAKPAHRQQQPSGFSPAGELSKRWEREAEPDAFGSSVPRHANAWLDDPAATWQVGKPTQVHFNIGPQRSATMASEQFAEPRPTSDGGQWLYILLRLPGDTGSVRPGGARLFLPKEGPTKPLTFTVTPARPGALELRFGVYLQHGSLLLQELTTLVPVIDPSTPVPATDPESAVQLES